jgi:hypothetical protein
MMLIKRPNLDWLLNNIEKAGGSDKALARLGQIEDLEKEAENARSVRDSTNRDRVEAENQLSAVLTQIDQAIATRDRQNAENATLFKKNAKAESELATVMEKVNANSSMIKFANHIQLLFSDISKISPVELMELAALLQMICGARVNPAAIYPIDYEGVRGKAIALLEQALGKALVPRDLYDDMLKRTGEQHDDLMMDKLGKIERERTKFIAIKDGAERALNRALTAELSAETKRFIVLRRCRACGLLIAAVPAGTEYSVAKCCFCGTPNP